MAPLNFKGEEKQMVITQVSFGGFDKNVTAKDLTEFLENEIGSIWRCRLKTSWTPPDSYPDFDVKDFSKIQIWNDYDRVVPHAFVHFVSPEAVQRAINASGMCDLVLNGCPLKVNVGRESISRVEQRRTDERIKFSNVSIEIGHLVTRDEFMVSWKEPQLEFDFIFDCFDGTCNILFTKDVAFSFKDKNQHVVVKCNFKVQFYVRDVNRIDIDCKIAPFALLFHLSSSPRVYYRTADDDINNLVPFNLLDDEDPWIRTTDFTSCGAIGSCSCYRISFSPRLGGKMEKLVDYFKDRKISVEKPRSMWQQLKICKEPGFGMPMNAPFFCIQNVDGITFKVLFLVNALLHKGIVNPHQLSHDFFSLLRNQTDIVNITVLKHMFSYKRSIFDAYKRLESVQGWLIKNPKLLQESKISNDNVEVRRLVITPTKAYCLLPQVELSNRVLRKYIDTADRFLRVTFMDESMHPLNSQVLSYNVASIVKDITSASFSQKTMVFKRIKDILSNGFVLCGRKYLFLAFSSNQLRDRSAWFFAEDDKTNVKSIRSWMGRFNIRNVAKCAARMGQCFSSTYATINVSSKEFKEIDDITRNNYIFSDGIGKMTPDLAMEVSQKLQLTDNPPSAFQIRYAGCKGVVACWPGNNDGFRLFLRPSMNKFESNHETLEVVSWTRFQPGFLNRQIITLLSSLGVSDDVFLKMQDSMIYKLNRILEDVETAFEILTTSCSENGNVAAIMLSAGFIPQTEPHLKSMLSCIRSAQMGDLLSKSRIFVPLGRWLMGCLDEVGVLESGQCFIQSSTPILENCFCKHGSRFAETKKNVKVVTGTVAIMKNPCLHPGDVRILEAVDVPELHHLVDCLVFPQNGDRPHSDEASGSDLDGDLYFVTWDNNLIPPSKKSWPPMDYSPAKVGELKRPVNHQDIIEFFVRNMVSENLGVICNAHVVHADLSELGALDEKCIKLAELAAMAVDFPKTGKHVLMPSELRPKLYPNFMGKEEFLSYKSSKVLGKLYGIVKDAEYEHFSSDEPICSPENIPYDTDLEVSVPQYLLNDAWNIKCWYDRQVNALLGQYRIHTEGEIVTGHFWSMPKSSNRKQGEIKEKLKHSYSVLRKETRHCFEEMEPDFWNLPEDKRRQLYEEKASAWYQVTYHPLWVEKFRNILDPYPDQVPARLSFPWIATDYLVQIKVRHRGLEGFQSGRPIDSLARYLLDKM